MQTIQYRRTRIWEMKKGKYKKTLAKNQVCEIFQMRDIGKNGLPKLRGTQRGYSSKPT